MFYTLRYHHKELYDRVQKYNSVADYKSFLDEASVKLYGRRHLLRTFWLLKHAKYFYYVSVPDVVCLKCRFLNICTDEDWGALMYEYSTSLGVTNVLDAAAFNIKKRDEELASNYL